MSDFECNPVGTMRLIGDLRGEIRALQLTEQNLRRQLAWQPIETAPKDKPILGLCVHPKDPDDLCEVDGNLTLYAAHAEGLSHVVDGPHVLVWGGAWDDRSYEDPGAGWLPDWWFLADGNFETAANPTHWAPVPEVEDKPAAS